MGARVFLFSFRAMFSLIDSLREDSLSVAKLAMQFLVRAVGQGQADEHLLQTLKSRLATVVTEGNAQIRMRVYDVAIDVAKTSADNFNRTLQYQFLPSLIKELRDVEDPLSVASALEVATGLANTPWGEEWLRSQGVFAEIDGQLANIAASDFASLLLPKFVEFMGKQ